MNRNQAEAERINEHHVKPQNQFSHAFQERAFAALSKFGASSPRQEEWRKSDPFAFTPEKVKFDREKKRDQHVAAEIANAFPSAFRITLSEDGVKPVAGALAPAGLTTAPLYQIARDFPVIFDRCETGAAPFKQALRTANAAYAENGFYIAAERGANLAEPILIQSELLQSETIRFTRNQIVAAENSRLTLVDCRLMSANTPQNDVTEIFVEDNAELVLIAFAYGAEAITRYQAIAAKLGRNARFRVIMLEPGGSPARCEINVELAGDGAEFFSYAVAYPKAGRKADFCEIVTHSAPHGRSVQNFRFLTGDHGSGAVQSKTIVTENGQKTEASQSLRALTVGDESDYFAKPELEIYADDVKCAHGSAVGKPDEDALFYMRSRGIPDAEARYLLTEAFLFADIEESGLLNETVIEIVKQNFRREF